MPFLLPFPAPCPSFAPFPAHDCTAGNSRAAWGTARCLVLALMWQRRKGEVRVLRARAREPESRCTAVRADDSIQLLISEQVSTYSSLLFWKVTVIRLFMLLSTPAGRMTCLLLSNHPQITCFRSAAAPKDSPKLLNAFSSLDCTVPSHYEACR